MTNDTLNTVQALARRCLWIAYCWNDHNFDAAYGYARETAKAHGINSLEDANAIIEQMQRMEQVVPMGAPADLIERLQSSPIYGGVARVLVEDLLAVLKLLAASPAAATPAQPAVLQEAKPT